MKHILAPILLLVFLFPSLALGEEFTIDDLVEREGLYYKKSTDVPFLVGSIKRNVKTSPF